MFRRSASLAILHHESFAAIPSVARVRLEHMNRNVSLSHELQRGIAIASALSRTTPDYYQGELGGRKTAPKKKNKFLGTEVPRNFSDQCSLDFAYFLCLFSGRRSKSSQELCSWELFFLILGGFSPCEELGRKNEPLFRRVCIFDVS